MRSGRCESSSAAAPDTAAAACDVFLALGTTLGVSPAAALPAIALSNGARLVIVNAQETPFDRYADAVSHANLGDLLPALVERVTAA